MEINNRINLILNNSNYKKYLKEIEKCEEKRQFCRHNLKHFLDVARIAYIMCLEKKLNYSKDVIYAIGLLHDIGRFEQYKDGTPHDKASYNLSVLILQECNFNKEEIEIIGSGILNHRTKTLDETSIENIIYRSDKISRDCFNCKAIELCNWDENKKNMNITY